jgi:hypothetical protein
LGEGDGGGGGGGCDVGVQAAALVAKITPASGALLL